MSDKVVKGGGEGNRPAARRYNKQTEKFTHSEEGKKSIKKAGQLSKEEAKKAKKAEQEGKNRAKEKDPEVARDYGKPSR
jgi:hypothetical protein